MNIYSVIQVVLICGLYGLKLSPAGMLYPLAIVLLIPIRMFMEKFMYTHKEFEAVSCQQMCSVSSFSHIPTTCS